MLGSFYNVNAVNAYHMSCNPTQKIVPIFDVNSVMKPQQKFLLDSGANANFYVQGARDIKILPTHTPITAMEPSGCTMTSTGKATLEPPSFPEEIPPAMMKGHILPTLKNHSILSLG